MSQVLLVCKLLTRASRMPSAGSVAVLLRATLPPDYDYDPSLGTPRGVDHWRHGFHLPDHDARIPESGSIAVAVSHATLLQAARMKLPASFPTQPGIPWWLLWISVIVAATAVSYVAFTGHIWEDYLITFRFSRNWARGHGLVYVPGERIHGFTSFLNVMIPAVADWFYGGDSIMPALSVYRTACIGALTVAAAVLGVLLRRDPLTPRWAVWVLPLAIGADFKTIAYAGNGQETAFVWLFTALAMWSVRSSPADGWPGFGLATAGLMYSRPDGFVFATILGLAAIFVPRGGRADVVGLAKAALLALACYLPWLAWVWWYYGTPVPHTIIAKAGAYGEPWDDAALGARLLRCVNVAVSDASGVFAPIYANDADWPIRMRPLSFALAGCACLPLLLRSSPRVARRAALAFALSAGYLLAINLRMGTVFPWYTAFAALTGIVSLVSLICWTIATRGSRLGRAAVAATGTIMLVGMALLSFHGWRQMALQQREIEWGVRAKIGHWLAEHAAPGDRVLLEPIGYIGFFSNAALYDYPGLVSPHMVAVRRAGHRGLAECAVALQPEWLVLRRQEAEVAAKVAAIRDHYDVAYEMNATAPLRRIIQAGWYHGTGYLAMDCHFIVFRRTTPADRAPFPVLP